MLTDMESGLIQQVKSRPLKVDENGFISTITTTVTGPRKGTLLPETWLNNICGPSDLSAQINRSFHSELVSFRRNLIMTTHEKAE